MPLAPGTRVGAYEIIGPIGAGGMGEVYRARDPRLERDVAIKVLPESSSGDENARLRLQREARAASALNHPHILTIYDVGRLDSEPRRDYIAMEFIDGSTLRDWLAPGRDPESIVDQLIQIADGLAKAHEANIVHRDLKPDNIMVTRDGYAKILDFGLAKNAVAAIDDQTQARTLTAAGAIVGTPGYMAPEQVRGGAATAQSDIFSFGCVVFEAFARRRAFAGMTALETAQQILNSDPPPLRTFLPAAPPELQRIVTRCLAKDPAQRYASMKDVIAELKRLRDHAGAPRRMARLTQITFDKAVEQFPAIDPGGKRVVFAREVGKVRHLFMTSVDDGSEERLTESEFDDIQPSWSPSGDALLFVRGRERDARLEPGDVFGRYIGSADVLRLDLATRKTAFVLNDAVNPSWSPDGSRIAFDCTWSGPQRIWMADSRGRNPQQITTAPSDAESHVRPRWSPDGRCIVFQNIEGTKFDIRVADLQTKTMKWVTDDYTMDLHPVWSPDGESIFFSSYRAGGINVWRIPVDVDGTPIGGMEQVTSGPGQDVDLDISASGKLAIAILKQNADVWRLPVDPRTGAAAGAPEPVIATTRENSRGAWSRDGRIAFNSDRGGDMNLWLFAEGKTRQLTRGAGGDYQPNWSPDGRSLAFFSGRAGSLDIWRLDLDGGEPVRLTHGEGINLNPFFSPDGKRVAFQSDRDGRLEVWVMNADGSDPRQLTSVGAGGHFLRWSAGGARILFRCPSGPKPRVMSVPSAGGDAEPVADVNGGSHISLSPDESMIMDVVAHRTLWVSPLHGGEPRRVFEFDDGESRIDYPVWSPDGRWILFDRFVPRGGDVWLVEP